MPNQQEVTESAMVRPAWVRQRLGLTRQALLKLEDEGVLVPVRYTATSQRRYDRSAVEALAAGTDR